MRSQEYLYCLLLESLKNLWSWMVYFYRLLKKVNFCGGSRKNLKEIDEDIDSESEDDLDIYYSSDEESDTASKSSSHSLFLTACEGGDLDTVKEYDTILPQDTVQEGFYRACTTGKIRIVRYFLDNYDISREVMNTAVKIAVINGRLETTEQLFKEGASFMVAIKHAKSRNIIDRLYELKHRREKLKEDINKYE